MTLIPQNIDATTKGSDNTRTSTALIIEDEAQVRAFIVAVLKQLGLNALEAEDGDKALTLAQQPHDLLWTDGNYSYSRKREEDLTSGESFLRDYATSGHTQPAIFGSDADVTLEQLRGKYPNVTIKLNKPFSLAEIRSAIRIALGQRLS